MIDPSWKRSHLNESVESFIKYPESPQIAEFDPVACQDATNSPPLSPADLRTIRNRQLSALFAARAGVDMGLFITVVDTWDEVLGVVG